MNTFDIVLMTMVIVTLIVITKTVIDSYKLIME